jgi:WD40 repeat protein
MPKHKDKKNKDKKNKYKDKSNNSLAFAFTYPLNVFSSKTNMRKLQYIFPSGRKYCFEGEPLGAMQMELNLMDRLRLASQGTLCMMLLGRLFGDSSQNVHNDMRSRLVSYVLTRFHRYNTAHCFPVPVNLNHNGSVHAVVFDYTTGLLVTGCEEQTNTVNIFDPSSKKSQTISDETGLKKGHFFATKSVVSHPTGPFLATVGGDNALKIWEMSSSGKKSAYCLCTLHSSCVLRSVAFHPTESLLATGSDDNTAKLLHMIFDYSSATSVATLKGHSGPVKSVMFHPILPLLATGSEDGTAKLWRLSADNSSATCVATLMEHSGAVNSVAFHPTAPILATASADKTAKLWRISANGSSVKCVATLMEHSGPVNSVVFHPTLPLLATASDDKTAKLWRLTKRRMKSSRPTAICVATLVGHRGAVNSVAFHPTAPLVVTGSDDNTAKLWR